MTKADLVERVTAQIARTAGPMISKKDCARVVDSFLDAIKQALQEQKNIEVRGFGTFKIRHRKTRMARNPRTGSPVEVSARPVPVFKPSKELRAMVASAHPEVPVDNDNSRSLMKALGSLDLRPNLVEIRCPVLALYGSRDAVMVAGAQMLSQGLAECDVRVLPDVGHEAFLEAPDETFAVLRRFLCVGPSSSAARHRRTWPTTSPAG